MIDALVELDSVRAHLVATDGSARPLRPDETLIMLNAAAAAEDMIRDNWPVRTGYSASRWRVYVETLALRFVNDADYAEYVHFAGEVHTAWAEAFSLVDELIISPLIAALKAAITANARPAVASVAQQNRDLSRLGIIRLVPTTFGGAR